MLGICEVQTNLDRTRFPPWGVQGGKEGRPGRFTLIDGASGAERSIEKEKRLRVFVGDRICVETGGGGGYGPPEDRALHLIQSETGIELRGRARRIQMIHGRGELDPGFGGSQAGAGEGHSIGLESERQLHVDIQGSVSGGGQVERAHIDFADVAGGRLLVIQARAQIFTAGVEMGLSLREDEAAIAQIEAANGEIDDGLQAARIAG